LSIDGPGAWTTRAKRARAIFLDLVRTVTYQASPCFRGTTLVPQSNRFTNASPSCSPEAAMFLMLSKKPRKSNRSRSNRYRASLKAKNKRRQARVYQAHRA
jgi:hypothetical protein